MRHFNYDDNEEHQEEVDHFFKDEDETEDGSWSMPDDFDMAHMGLAAIDINLKVLKSAIKVCEQSPFWKWKSQNKKEEMITMVYSKFLKLIEAK